MRPWLYVPCDWRRPESGERFQTYWCDHCRYGMVYPRPTPAEIAEFYKVEYYTHGQDGAPPPVDPFGERVRTAISWRMDRSVEIYPEWFERVIARRDAKICDLGCGDGRLMKALVAEGYRDVQGMEPDPAARATAAAAGLLVHDGKLEELPDAIRSHRFDFVFMSHVLEHALDPVAALRNAGDAAGDDGRVIVDVPNNDAQSLINRHVCWSWLDIPRHLNFFTVDSLRRMGAQVGLEAEVVEFYGYNQQFRNKWIGNEQLIWDRLHAADPAAVHRPRNSVARSWVFMIHSIFLPVTRRYISFRIIFKKAVATPAPAANDRA